MESTAPPPVPISPPDLLWDQGNNISDSDISSQDFRDGAMSFDIYDTRAADDFLVPEDYFWEVRTVIVYGTFDSILPNDPESLDIVFFTDKNGRPGDEIPRCVYNDVAPRDLNDPSFITDLPRPCYLKSGTYWVSVRANMLFLPDGQWFWHGRTIRLLSPFVWENPGNGFGTGCVNFLPAEEHCGADFPDLAYQLTGVEHPLADPIPTLGEWGMAAVAVVLGLVGIIALTMRRKRGIEAL